MPNGRMTPADALKSLYAPIGPMKRKRPSRAKCDGCGERKDRCQCCPWCGEAPMDCECPDMTETLGTDGIAW